MKILSREAQEAIEAVIERIDYLEDTLQSSDDRCYMDVRETLQSAREALLVEVEEDVAMWWASQSLQEKIWIVRARDVYNLELDDLALILREERGGMRRDSLRAAEMLIRSAVREALESEAVTEENVMTVLTLLLNDLKEGATMPF